jgi:COP9 signalosome complex subunit 3
MLQPLLAVLLVRDAILRLDPSGATFTSTHLLLTKLCLHSKAYAHALPVLDKYICHFPPGPDQAYLKYDKPLLCAQHESSAAFITGASGLSSKLSHKDYQLYFLYGGMIYMAVKEWGKALHFLNIVISSPVINSVSMIMVEAYKKWILASLLKNGEVSPVPWTPE